MPSYESRLAGFALAQKRANRKYRRIFFATDLHSSEIVFRRFVGAAKFYEADALIMGGDVTGKNVIPIVEGVDGKFHFNFQGQEFRGLDKGQLPDYELASGPAEPTLPPWRFSITRIVKVPERMPLPIALKFRNLLGLVCGL